MIDDNEYCNDDNDDNDDDGDNNNNYISLIFLDRGGRWYWWWEGLNEQATFHHANTTHTHTVSVSIRVKVGIDIHADPFSPTTVNRTYSHACPGGPCVGVHPLGGELNLPPSDLQAGVTKNPVVSVFTVPS